ncbi:hypothetical protein E7T09_13005 [Deinococcus sp. KSM4-11]|uniref:hypothetical protein n=1 Tax=Deinococcus sp. KSM4-11 TaxID=2568654 RepID=UPI0010A3D000|nr:hypothetical protein [Deinococcus sp. KSM4-11]THF86143.1 hypothetical protein E7T09_13005 [Deinococcus sp. KSM4-11]
MTTPHDLTPFLHGLNPDPDAMTDARAFAFMQVDPLRLWNRLEDLVMTFAHFAQDQTGPALQDAQTEARRVLAFAVSGLYALMVDSEPAHAWGVLAHARQWAVGRCHTTSEALSPDTMNTLAPILSNLYALPGWAAAQGYRVEAGRLAAWWVVASLLEAAPTLEDGDGEEMIASVLEALQDGPQPHARAAHLMAAFDQVPAVHIAQYVEALGIGRARVSLGGGEDYEVTRSDCTLTPLPDGEGFLYLYSGTPDALTVRLEREEMRTVCAALGFELGEDTGPISPLN